MMEYTKYNMNRFDTILKKIVLCQFLMLILMSGYSQTRQEVDLILNHYTQFLLATDTSRGNAIYFPSLTQEGIWPDINYKDNQSGAWQVAEHMRRIRVLALDWSDQGSPLYHSDSVKNDISKGLDHWYVHRYKSRNWWHNEIGIPQIIRDIIVLMKGHLSSVEFNQSLEIMGQYKLNGTGANLVWSADLGFHYRALTNNIPLMKQCRDTILSVIKVTTEEGVQPDYSFHQHGKRLQMYHYGGAFLLDNVRLAWELRNSWLAFPPSKIQILTDFVLKGWQWMARGINTVPGTIDRAASRKNALHSADIRKIIPFMYEINPDSAAAFKNMLAIQKGEKSLKGYRYFPYSDFTAYQRDSFSFFLKTNSSRTLLTESINEENIQGDLLNSGDSYFISNGKEYYDLMPFWDWQRLPGITNFSGNKKNKIKQQAFVGNVCDSDMGLAVMDYSLKKDNQSLTAKKFWASYKNITVSLVAGLKTTGLEEPAFTVLDQCRWQNEVTLNRRENRLSEGTHEFNNIDWVHHNSFVYIPLYKDSIVIDLENKKGNWAAINKGESKEVIRDKVFMTSIIHSSENSASGYVVAYAPAALQADSIAKNPSWKILRNDSLCQAVNFGKEVMMIALYKEGRSQISKTLTVTVNKPCLLLMSGRKMYVSDPAHEGGWLSIRRNNKTFKVYLPADGTTVLIR